MIKDLLIGCGTARDKRVRREEDSPDWEGELVTLDMVEIFKPDVVWDLTELPYPFEDNTFDSVHAYEVLEHIGQQGDYRTFFAQFEEFWRILKPNGTFCATVPGWNGRFALADPGHTRVITPDTLTFLNQKMYDVNADYANTDYRFCYKADFETIMCNVSAPEEDPTAISMAFALMAIKVKPITKYQPTIL